MNSYIALFRGVNVGGNNILPMKDLSNLLEKNSYHNVRTYIQSGNVVFQSAGKPDADIHSLIEKKFNFKPEILILKKKEFLKAVENNPFRSTVGKEVHFYFCKTKPEPNLNKLEELKSKSEKYAIKGLVFYLYAPDGIGKSKLVANIEKCLGVRTTGRNLNTINKLVELVQNT